MKESGYYYQLQKIIDKLNLKMNAHELDEILSNIILIIFFLAIILLIVRAVKKKNKKKLQEQQEAELNTFSQTPISTTIPQESILETFNNETIEQQEDNPQIKLYSKKPLLTQNELYFYTELKPICEKYNLHILSKIRMADLLQIDTYNRGKWFSAFGKVNSKHIDFALARPENLNILLLIELDDNSHRDYERKERDKFVNDVYDHAGYKLLRIYNTEGLENKIVNMLNLKEPENKEKEELNQ